MGKLTENRVHEATLSKCYMIKHSIVLHRTLTLGKQSTCTNSRFAASEALRIVSESSSTNTPTGSAPWSLAAFDISFAIESGTERFELGQMIIPIKFAPASAAIIASLADVMPHILTKGWLFPCSFDEHESFLTSVSLHETWCLRRELTLENSTFCPFKPTEIILKQMNVDSFMNYDLVTEHDQCKQRHEIKSTWHEDKCYTNLATSRKRTKNWTARNWSFLKICSSESEVTPSDRTCRKRAPNLARSADFIFIFKMKGLTYVHENFFVTDDNLKMLNRYTLQDKSEKHINSIKQPDQNWQET